MARICDRRTRKGPKQMKGSIAFELVLDRLVDAHKAMLNYVEREARAVEHARAMEESRERTNKIALDLQNRMTEIDPDGSAAFLNTIARKLKDHVPISEEDIKRIEEIAFKLDPIPF